MKAYENAKNLPETFVFEHIKFQKIIMEETILLRYEKNELEFFKGSPDALYISYLSKTKKYTGNKLLKIFTMLAVSLGCKYIYLIDGSQKDCKMDEEVALFYPYSSQFPYSIFLYLTGEIGFYAKNGFYPVDMNAFGYQIMDPVDLSLRDFSQRKFSYLINSIPDIISRKQFKKILGEEYKDLTIKEGLYKLLNEKCHLLSRMLRLLREIRNFKLTALAKAVSMYPLYWRKDL